MPLFLEFRSQCSALLATQSWRCSPAIDAKRLRRSRPCLAWHTRSISPISRHTSCTCGASIEFPRLLLWYWLRFWHSVSLFLPQATQRNELLNPPSSAPLSHPSSGHAPRENLRSLGNIRRIAASGLLRSRFIRDRRAFL